MKKIAAVFRDGTNYKVFLMSVFIIGLGYGIHKGLLDNYLAEIVGITVDEAYMDEAGKFDLSATNLIAYSHGEYFALGEKLGKFGYSVKK